MTVFSELLTENAYYSVRYDFSTPLDFYCGVLEKKEGFTTSPLFTSDSSSLDSFSTSKLSFNSRFQTFYDFVMDNGIDKLYEILFSFSVENIYGFTHDRFFTVSCQFSLEETLDTLLKDETFLNTDFFAFKFEGDPHFTTVSFRELPKSFFRELLERVVENFSS